MPFAASAAYMKGNIMRTNGHSQPNTRLEILRLAVLLKGAIELQLESDDVLTKSQLNADDYRYINLGHTLRETIRTEASSLK